MSNLNKSQSLDSSAGALQHFVGSVLAKLSKQNNDSMAEVT
jgi:hypothetical protein